MSNFEEDESGLVGELQITLEQCVILFVAFHLCCRFSGPTALHLFHSRYRHTLILQARAHQVASA